MQPAITPIKVVEAMGYKSTRPMQRAADVASFVDDRQSLPIQVRLPAHVTAAAVAVLAIGSPAPLHPGLNAVEAAISIVGLAWMTNLFNFMDGSDGLAGGMAGIGF